MKVTTKTPRSSPNSSLLKRSESIEISPIFRWAGSKKKSLPELSKFWKSNFTRYVEPFAGSACLFFKLMPTSALLADLNSSLIDAYKVIRDHPRKIAKTLYAIPRNAKTYYEIRKSFGEVKNPIERSAQFVFLNRNCFNGIFRTNLKGEFNVPFGYDQGKYPSVEDFEAAAIQLKNALLLNCDFGSTLCHLRRGDFVYLDPPYAATGTRTFTEYGQRTFRADDLDRLQKHLIRIDNRGASFVVSYADCPRAREIGTNWNCMSITVRRHIAGFASKRRMADELIITNLDLPSA